MEWTTNYPTSQDTLATDQPTAMKGDVIVPSMVNVLATKLDAVAKLAGDSGSLPSGCLKARVTALENAPVVGWRETYLARAVAKAGILAEEIGAYFDEFDGGESARWIPDEQGAVGVVTALGGGIMKLHATAPSSECNLGLYSYPVPRLLIDVAKPWYAALRFWIPSNPIPSDGEAGMYLRLVNTDDGGDGLTIGVAAGYYPLLGSTKFMAATMNGANLESKLSTVSVDNTDFHVLELWCDGTHWFFACDDEAPIQFVGTYPPSGMVGAVMGGKAGGSNDLDMLTDKLLLAFPLPVVAAPA